MLKEAQSRYMRSKPDFAEIYSKPRIYQEATAQKFQGVSLRPGWSLDLSTKDSSTGKAWDLSDRKAQAKVMKRVKDTEPFCTVGSLPCTPLSQLQGLNKARREPDIVARELRLGKLREILRRRLPHASQGGETSCSRISSGLRAMENARGVAIRPGIRHRQRQDEHAQLRDHSQRSKE